MTAGPRPARPLRLHDTARRRTVELGAGPVVNVYVCGITPYDATHLGHAATYIAVDVLERRLRDRGHEVRTVRNITDVDDDMLAAARRRGVHHLDLAYGELARFDADMAALGCLAPWSEPRASGAIADVRGLIHELLDRGVAYVDGSVVRLDFSAAAGSSGPVSGLDREAMLARARAATTADPADLAPPRDPLDPVLWRPSAPDEPSWASPWGPGRPGWHVECAAMARRELDHRIDIHAGGCDLAHPHHDCVAAMHAAVAGRRVVDVWYHRELVCVDGEKMSKSRGNLVFVRDLLARSEGRAVRLAVLAHHPRRRWEWRPDDLVAAEGRLARWRSATRGRSRGGSDEVLEEVRARLDDDLDTPGALEVLDVAAARGVDVSRAAALLGVSA